MKCAVVDSKTGQKSFPKIQSDTEASAPQYIFVRNRERFTEYVYVP